MKLNLSTRLFPQYNPMISLAENKAKKEEEKKKEAEEKAQEELMEALSGIKSFALGTTPNFVIDLNKDLLKLEDIEQLFVTFGQFGKMVQREMLFFSDNYDVTYEIDEEDGEYIPLSKEIVTDEHDIFDDNIKFMKTPFYGDITDSEGKYTYLEDEHHEFYRNIEVWNSEYGHIMLERVYKENEDGYRYRIDKNGRFYVFDEFEGKIIYLEHPDLYQKHRWKHPHQTIRNPKFTYDKVFNKLTLTLSQNDTLTRYKPTDWYYYDEDKGETKPSKPYWQGNPSLVMIEVKIKVKRKIDHHLGDQVVIRPQEYWAVADTIEHSLIRPKEPIMWDTRHTGADLIYATPRFRMYFGDYSVPEDIKFLPDRVEELPYSRQTTMANLLRDGLRAISRPVYARYTEDDSEGHHKGDIIIDPFGYPEQVSRFWCLMIPLHVKLKIKDIKLLFGGSPGVADNVDYDARGLHFLDFNHDFLDSEGKPLADSEGRVYWEQIEGSFELREKAHGEQWFDSLNRYATPMVIPRPGYYRGESCTFHSDYVIDPDGVTPENPMGEYICWYICSKETVTGNISRFYGPGKYREDQRHEPYYEFLIKFEEVGKAGH